TLTAAALLGSRLRAQAPTPSGVQPPAQTRVAFINLEYVFQNYEKAKNFKKEMDLIIDPKRKEAEKLKKDMLDWQNYLTGGKCPPQDKEKYENAIVSYKRKLEDIGREVQALVGKRGDEQNIQLYKDITAQVAGYARNTGFHAVFCYVDETK